MEKSKVSLNIDSIPEDQPIMKNNFTVEEAINYLKDNNYSPISDGVLFYVKYVDEIDEKPEQLIGTKSQEDAIMEEYEKAWVDVVAVGPEVTTTKIGDKILINPKFWVTAIMEVYINGLKFGLLKEGLIAMTHSKK